MNIGDVSEATGLPAKTIRYYEDIGLVRPARKGNGYRDFSDQDVHKVRFLGRARTLGFSIEECRSLLELYEDAGRESAAVKSIARDHLTRIDAKIADLAQLRDMLGHLIDTCAGDNRPDCPILDDLAGATGSPRKP